MNNREKLSKMSNKELVEFLRSRTKTKYDHVLHNNVIECIACPVLRSEHQEGKNCRETLLEWFEKEVEE